MKLQTILYLLAFSTSALSGDCEAGFGKDECVSYFSDSSCNSYAGSYKPTCKGNCFVFPFKGLKVKGNGINGTNCEAFYDTKCQQKIGETGNIHKLRSLEVRGKGRKNPSDTGANPIPGQLGGDVNCKGFGNGGGANSMKCYFHC